MKQKYISFPAEKITRFVLVFFLIIFFPVTISGAELESSMRLLTITKPGPAEAVAPSVRDLPLLPAAETFAVRGVAQPQKFINLYSWSIIPGTEGNTNINKTITAFAAEQLGSDGVKFSWKPRRLFQKEAAAATLAQAGKSCEVLKTHCWPQGDQPLGEASTSCPGGNVPADLDCTLPRKYQVFHEIAKPGSAQTKAAEGKVPLLLPAGTSEADLGRILNNTLLTGTQCRSGNGCEYDGYPIGWRTALAPVPATAKPLLTPDLTAIAYEHLNVDEANGFIPALGEGSPGNPWATDIIPSGTYAPNIALDTYSGLYVFSYFNFFRALNENTGSDPTQPLPYEAQSFFPVKDLVVLVDGFDQYELYAVEDGAYRVQEGVTRENGQLLKIIRDPSAEEVTVNFAASGLDPEKTYHFALFEVRDSDQTHLPPSYLETLQEKIVAAEDCSGDPAQPQSCTALPGHLVSANSELSVNLQTGTIAPLPSPLKFEWQILEQEGHYSRTPIRSDPNGEMRCGENAEQECTFPKTILNPLAAYQFLAGTYPSANSGGQSADRTAFSVRTSFSGGNIFQNVRSLLGKALQFPPAENLYGVVFDSWTKEIVPAVRVALTGSTAETKESVRALQKTAADGLFSFASDPGEYLLEALAVVDRADTFLFPSSAYPTPADPQAPEACGRDGIFANVYCALLPIVTTSSATVRNLAIDPTVRGTIENESESLQIFLVKNGTTPVASTWTVPGGKFSFLVPPGEYVISEVRDRNGKVLVSPQKAVRVEASESGKPQRPADVLINLES